MNFLSNNQQTMSSREIAELTNKEHRNVLADCDKLNEYYKKMGLAEISAGVYTHPNTGKQKHREYMLTKLQTLDLMTGYRIDLRIKVNRRWAELEEKEQAHALPQNYKEALLALVQKEEEKEKLLEQNAELTKENQKLLPRSQFVDIVFNTEAYLTGSQVCKTLNLGFGNKTLFKKLRENGIFYTNKNEPKQEYVDKGYFRLREVMINDVIKIQPLFSQKGLGFIAKKFNIITNRINPVKTINN